MRLQCEFDIAAGVSAEDTILKTLFLVNFMTLPSLLSKMFFLVFLSLSILFSVFHIMFYVHICLCVLTDCHCNDYMPVL